MFDFKIFLSHGSTKIYSFHSGVFSREVTSLFEKRTILCYGKFIFLFLAMVLCMSLASVSDSLN